MWLLSASFQIFSMASKRLQQFHFTVYSIMIIITVFCILLKLHGIFLLSLVNQKSQQQINLNEILSDKRRTIRKTKMRKRKNLNTEKWLIQSWWEYFVSGVTPKESFQNDCIRTYSHDSQQSWNSYKYCMIQVFGCIDSNHIPIEWSSNTFTIIYVTNILSTQSTSFMRLNVLLVDGRC